MHRTLQPDAIADARMPDAGIARLLVLSGIRLWSRLYTALHAALLPSRPVTGPILTASVPAAFDELDDDIYIDFGDEDEDDEDDEHEEDEFEFEEPEEEDDDDDDDEDEEDGFDEDDDEDDEDDDLDDDLDEDLDNDLIFDYDDEEEEDGYLDYFDNDDEELEDDEEDDYAYGRRRG